MESLRLRSHCFVFISIRFFYKNAVSSHCSVFIYIRYENDRRSYCSSKAVLLFPLFKTMRFVNSCHKGANGDFECHCNQKSINKGICSVFKCFRFWHSHWKRIAFKTQRFQIYAFSFVFWKNSVFTAEQCERKVKTETFYSVFEQCERGLRVNSIWLTITLKDRTTSHLSFNSMSICSLAFWNIGWHAKSLTLLLTSTITCWPRRPFA